MDISDWLRGLGMERYADAFRANDIDLELLSELGEADLEKLGVLSLGHRKRLLKAIAALSSAAPPIAAAGAQPSPAKLQAERRHLTVMFVDLVGSTALSARFDPEETREVIRAYQNAVAGAVARYEGQVAKFMGDGVLAYFGWPKAHEDDAERAVRAGRAAVAAVTKLTTPQADPLAARVGIATGLVVVGDLIGEGAAEEEAVIGETPNLAARLQALAEPGSVVVSEGTRRLLGGLFNFASLGACALPGFAAPVPAFRVGDESLAEGRFEALHGQHLTPLVGREHETGLLLDRWRQARDGDGQIVLLAGEPGIGKSRMLQNLRERLTTEPQTRLLYFCSPYHQNTAFYPILDQIERGADLKRDDPPEVKLNKLEALFTLSGTSAAEATALTAALLSIPIGTRYSSPTLSPQGRKAKLQEIWVEQLVGLAAQRPVLMLLEDAHWIDPSSLEQFDLIIDRIQRLPVLLVVTFRPEFQPPWGRYPHVTALSLNRLSPRQSAAMIERIAGNKALPAEVLEQVVRKADGVPLFIEELTKAVLESGLLEDAGDHWRLAGPLPPLAIPATLHDSLMARLDRLAPVKEVAQVASVIGREFRHDLLAAAVDLDGGKLDEALGHLAAAELVFRRSMPPNEVYAFKHVLVQEAAYASLLRSKRQQVHARLALVLQERFPDVGESQPEVLARHFTEAGLVEEAIAYWHQAGQRAAERSAGPEAIAHLTKALELTRQLPDTRRRSEHELALQIALAPVLMLTEGFGSPRVRQAYLRARELCHEVADPDQLFKVTFGLWHVNQNRGDLRTGQAFADEALALAQQQGDPAYLLQAHHAAWTTLFHLGAPVACRDHTEQGRALYNVEVHQSHKFIFGGHDPGVCARNHGALSSWLLGYPDQALALSREAIALAQALGHPMSLMMAHCFTSFLHQFRGEPKAARERADATLAICTEQGIAPHYIATARIMRGWAVSALGEAEVGAAEVRDGLADLLATEMNARRPHYLMLLAEAEAWAGRLDQGLVALGQAQELVDQTDERRWEAEIHRFTGELILRLHPSGKTAEAVACFERALRVAGEQGARALELRAATNLARVWSDNGKREEARDLLAGVYGWFVGGSNTPDLKQAKALLDELARASPKRAEFENRP